MLRARDFLAVTVPAALLAFAIQPLLDTAAPANEPAAKVRGDRLAEGAAGQGSDGVTVRVDAASRVTVVARGPAEPGPVEAARRAEETPVPVVRPRPREGCEGAISALAGREARQLLPSRCLV